MRKFAGEWVSAVLTRLGMQEGEAIESKMVSRRIEGAQKKVEERNFDIRKNLLEYDEVMDEQRKRVYSFRQGLLEGSPPKDMILEMIDSQIKDAAERFLADDYGAASFAEWAGQRLGVELTARDFKGASFEDAEEIAKTKAERQLHETIRQAMEENLPADADPSEWTWQALANWANTRFELNLKEKDLKKYARPGCDEFEFGREDLEEFLNEKASASHREARPDPGPRVPRSPTGAAVPWPAGSHHKFALAIDPASWAESRSGRDRPPDSRHRPAQLYALKEAELPVRIALMRYPGRSLDSTCLHATIARAWPPGRRERFHTIIDAEELRPLLRPEIEALLLELAHERLPGSRAGRRARSQARRGLSACSGRREARTATGDRRGPGRLASWADDALGVEIDRRRARHSMSPADARSPAGQRPGRQAPARDARDGEGRPAPDPRRELDGTPASDGPPAQLDRPAGLCPDRPQGRVQARGHADLRRDVERHRRPRHRPDLPGRAIRPRIPRLPGLALEARPGPDDPPVRPSRNWPPPPSRSPAASARQQDAAIAGSQQSTEKKREPVRNVGKKVGRNDLCPCGSGKKFKACCMRKQSPNDPF